MSKIDVIRSNAELERWLKANTWFEDAFANGLSFRQSGKAESSCRIDLGLEMAGTLRAGEERVIRDYVLVATDLRGVPADAAAALAAGHCCEGIELLPTDGGVAFRLDLPGRVDVACQVLEIETGAERREPTPPWTSEREFGARFPGQGLPLPELWVEQFRQAGIAVRWRHLGSDAQEPFDPTEYEGWYLQEPGRIASSQTGLFFSVCRVRGGELVVQWQRGDMSEEFWDAAKRVLGQFGRAEVWCGNCQFSSSEWLRFVQDGSLPSRLHGNADGPARPLDGC